MDRQNKKWSPLAQKVLLSIDGDQLWKTRQKIRAHYIALCILSVLLPSSLIVFSLFQLIENETGYAFTISTCLAALFCGAWIFSFLRKNVPSVDKWILLNAIIRPRYNKLLRKDVSTETEAYQESPPGELQGLRDVLWPLVQNPCILKVSDAVATI